MKTEMEIREYLAEWERQSKEATDPYIKSLCAYYISAMKWVLGDLK